MTKTSRPALLLAFVLLAAMLAGAALPAEVFAARATSVTKGLDFIHARQLSTGGFANASATDSARTTPWAMLAIVAGQENPAKWVQSGKDPLFDYLQSINLERAAVPSDGTPTNVPQYYSILILAYAAVDQPELIYHAGTPRIDLLAKLLTYADDDGHFSPATSGDKGLWDVTTTTWALLALRAAGQSDGNVSAASAWLQNVQNPDGGWPMQTGTGSGVDTTAAAVQALRAAGVSASSATIQNALTYLHGAQKSDGGFPDAPSATRSNAESTAWTMQALKAAGVDQATWTKNGHTPAQYLRGLQRASGVFEHRKGLVVANSMTTTTQATMALAGKAFPFSLGGKIYAPKHLPSFSSFKPGNGAVFSSTNDVLVDVAYVDPKGGTGINADAVRILVDGANKTSKAKVSSSRLSLKLVDLTYGQHTIEMRIADRAGNRRTSTHTITVSYAPSSGTSSSGGSTSTSGSTSSTWNSGITVKPSRTFTPTTASTPAATSTTPSTGEGSVTGTVLTPQPSPLPSASGSPAAAASTGSSSGGSGGVLGATLLLMLPLGAGLSYWIHRRHAAALANAGQGRLLAGGGTPWQRFKERLPGVSRALQ
ncbi:MAG TPA: terpene cyclase/mutase family protein [Thermoleophilia bacterium]|nr:terpene cyclase/mutase family protein [Thermoleophilia bacterium]